MRLIINVVAIIVAHDYVAAVIVNRSAESPATQANAGDLAN